VRGAGLPSAYSATSIRSQQLIMAGINSSGLPRARGGGDASMPASTASSTAIETMACSHMTAPASVTMVTTISARRAAMFPR
jgi:hypothetical protein